MYDLVNLFCQCLERLPHLIDVWVPVINTARAADLVTETAIGNVGVDTSARGSERAVRRKS